MIVEGKTVPSSNTQGIPGPAMRTCQGTPAPDIPLNNWNSQYSSGSVRKLGLMRVCRTITSSTGHLAIGYCHVEFVLGTWFVPL